MDGVLFLWPVPLSVLFSLPSPFFSVLLSLCFSTVLFDRAFHRWIPENWESGATRRVFLKIVNSFKTGH